MIERKTLTPSYWGASFTIEDADLEYLYNQLLERETPMTTQQMTLEIVGRRMEREERLAKQQEAAEAVVYFPKESYRVNQRLLFPALDFAQGRVVDVRAGHNPEYPDFDVLEVEFGEGGPRRNFAARLQDHKLNQMQAPGMNGADEKKTAEQILDEYGQNIGQKLEARLSARGDIVRIFGSWFPRALLVDVNVGHLNLAEAVLDVNGGGPLPTESLLEHIDLPDDVNPQLKTFSVNYAMQEDERFDEVGPAGKVLWYLRRMEPPDVLLPPRRLEYPPAPDDRSRLTPELVELERALDDELSPPDAALPAAPEVTLNLTFPHWRVGTLPLTPRLSHLFPTAFESPRIRFMLVDGSTGEKYPGWVVRDGNYVFGLGDLYKKYGVPVGGILHVRQAESPGEVAVTIQRRRPAREWVRTAVSTPDGRLSFSMNKSLVAVEYDELMIVGVDDPAAIDQAWLKTADRKVPFQTIVANMFRELAKLNPQSAVHAKSLYSAVNVLRRVPPGPIFAELVARPYYSHVGDLYWRFDESKWTE